MAGVDGGRTHRGPQRDPPPVLKTGEPTGTQPLPATKDTAGRMNLQGSKVKKSLSWDDRGWYPESSEMKKTGERVVLPQPKASEISMTSPVQTWKVRLAGQLFQGAVNEN